MEADNGVTETQGNDPNEMRRPASLSASGPYASWSSGAYAYDGAGNIKTIGASWFTYDKVSRLVTASLNDGPTGGGTQKQQSYTFDPFGNLTNIAGTPGRAVPTNSLTNRLNSPATAYDAAGNLTNWNGAVYQYDRFNQMIRMVSGTEDWAYVYTADDERFWSYQTKASGSFSRRTLRDLGGKVLREYLSEEGRWSVGTDYIYRDGSLLAAETQTGRRHFHLDHLGTPRLITRGSGYKAAYHVYYPFGEELTAFNQDSERMKFTGHERDLGSPAGAGDDLDYMHARHCSPVTGRFLSVDWVLGTSKKPQSWNRYSYARGNPLKYFDPNGLYVVVASKDRAVVAHTYANSPSFRDGFNKANRNQNIIVHLESVSAKDGRLIGRRGNTSWAGKPSMDGATRTFKGMINSYVKSGNRDATGALFGHEITHANELGKHGSITKVPGARASADGKGNYETEAARNAESAIKEELGASSKATLSLEETAEVFSPSDKLDQLSDEQREACLATPACMAPSGSTSERK